MTAFLNICSGKHCAQVCIWSQVGKPPGYAVTFRSSVSWRSRERKRKKGEEFSQLNEEIYTKGYFPINDTSVLETLLSSPKLLAFAGQSKRRVRWSGRGGKGRGDKRIPPIIRKNKQTSKRIAWEKGRNNRRKKGWTARSFPPGHQTPKAAPQALPSLSGGSGPHAFRFPSLVAARSSSVLFASRARGVIRSRGSQSASRKRRPFFNFPVSYRNARRDGASLRPRLANKLTARVLANVSYVHVAAGILLRRGCVLSVLQSVSRR